MNEFNEAEADEILKIAPNKNKKDEILANLLAIHSLVFMRTALKLKYSRKDFTRLVKHLKKEFVIQKKANKKKLEHNGSYQTLPPE